MYRIYILLTVFTISIAAFGSILDGQPDKSERVSKHTPIQTHQYSDTPPKRQPPSSEGWMHCEDCNQFYELPPRPTDFPTLIILNEPNGLAKCLEKYREESTDDLLQYLEGIRKEELKCLKKRRSDNYIQQQSSPNYPLYLQLSVLYYQPSSLCSALNLSSTPTVDRPLLRTFIALCKKYPSTSIKTMLATVESTPQTDESIKNFIAYKNNDIRKQAAALYDEPDHNTSAAHAAKDRNSKGSHHSKVYKVLSSAFKLLLPFGFFSSVSSSDDTETGSGDGAYYDAEGDDPADQFDCGNGETVNIDLICDGGSDCSNERDETADICCKKNSISGKYCNDKHKHNERWYLCNDGSGYVIPESYLCDEMVDCPNSVDETIGQCCASGPLPTGDECVSEDRSKCYFRCKNGLVIAANKACNGYNNCGDASDELSAKCCIRHYPGRYCAVSPQNGMYKCGSRDNPRSRDYVCRNQVTSHEIDPTQYPTLPNHHSFANNTNTDFPPPDNGTDDTETSDSFGSSLLIGFAVGGTLAAVVAIGCAVKYYCYPSCKKKTSYKEGQQEDPETPPENASLEAPI